MRMTQSVPSLSAASAQALATDMDATLVEFVRHLGGWSAFVVTPQAVRHVPFSKVNNNFLLENVIDWLDQVENPKLHNQESYWTLDEWYEAFITPFKPPEGKLVLAPAGVLHLMPLSIARNGKTERYLCDEYTVSFVPNLGALRVALDQARVPQSLLAVAYPGLPEWKDHPNEKDRQKYLDQVLEEAKVIAKLFSDVTSLHEKDATPQKVIDKAKEHDIVHFSCHGEFKSKRPEQSRLLLSDGHLTVQRIVSELRLSGTHLATLSACETHGLAVDAGEEIVGLVQAMMTVGAQAVVASLWKVADEVPLVLFKKFYEAVKVGQSPAQALQQAMQDVRQQPDWEHPYYWVAFQASGLAHDF